jgi:hypothetical protein
MAERLAQLQGSDYDLQDLEKILSSHDPMVVSEDGKFYLRSSAWDQLQEAAQVYSQAKRFVESLDSAAFIFFRDTAPLTIGHIMMVDDEGNKQRFVFGKASFHARARLRASGSAIRPTGQPTETEQEHAIIKTLRASEQHQEVADALRFFRKGDWSSLYKAFEIVEDHPPNNQGITTYSGLTKPSTDRFTRTAQSRDAIGDEARHAKRKYTPPRKPMSINEAKALIGDLIQKWIESKETETTNT